MTESVRVIKKYQNRKLYDTQDSCYVTLDGLAKMLRDGQDILVVDNNTKADVTALILTQVLYEQEKTSQSVLPVELLKTLVRNSQNSLYDFVQKFIVGAIDTQIKTQNDLDLFVTKLVQKGDLTESEGAAMNTQVKQSIENSRGRLDAKIEERLERYLQRKTATPEFTIQTDYSVANRSSAETITTVS